MSLLFAALADDFTGGADLAGMLGEAGVRTLLAFGAAGELALGYDAVVVCLKSRSVEAGRAQTMMLKALESLEGLEPRQVQFKYCSTFDSTPEGNIGPVTDALMSALGCEFTVAVPALPVNGRTQYLGHLFVDGMLLAESHMRDHPLNPMTDSNLVRWLGRQTRRRVGLIPLTTVEAGEKAIRAEMERQREGIALVDVVTEAHLRTIAGAVAGLKLITGSSGLARALPEVWARLGWLKPAAALPRRRSGPRGTLILAGSCSAATLGQLERWEAKAGAAVRMRVEALEGGEVDRLEAEALGAIERAGVATVRSSAPPEGRAPGAGSRIEAAFAELGRRLVASGRVGRLIVAGGETAGAVVDALGIRAMEVTASLDPGVPSLRTVEGPPLEVALKSGNFGGPDFFTKTIAHWEANA